MTDLKVRRLRFDFADPVPVLWHPANPAFSHAMNVFSFVAIAFEKMIVDAVREAKPYFSDPEIDSEATAFLRQEAQHANAHRQHVNSLIKQYPGLRETFDQVVASFDAMTESKSLEYRLAYIANLEATFTPSFKFLLDNEDKMFRPGDDRVASLLLWHLVEEVEHRSSALVIYNAVVGKRMYRLQVLPSVLRHIFGTLIPIYIDGMNTHVPESDRVIDTRTMSLSWRLRAALPKLTVRGARGEHRSIRGAFAEVSRTDKFRALGGLVRSQNPFFDPGEEDLPVFADEWFDRYERGDDIVHWYGSQMVG